MFSAHGWAALVLILERSLVGKEIAQRPIRCQTIHFAPLFLTLSGGAANINQSATGSHLNSSPSSSLA